MCCDSAFNRITLVGVLRRDWKVRGGSRETGWEAVTII